MSMYDLNNVPMDSPLWQLVAYCAGTGGSLLVIGSAAGVALMGMEKVGGLITRLGPDCCCWKRDACIFASARPCHKEPSLGG